MKILCEKEHYSGCGEKFTRQPYWILEKYKNYISATYYPDDLNYPCGEFEANFNNKTFKEVKKIIKEYGKAVIDNITEEGDWIDEVNNEI